MKKLFWIFICIFLVSCGEKSASISTDSSKGTAEIKISAQSVLSAMDKGLFRDGELIVKFRTGVVRESSLSIHKAAGAVVKKTSAFAPSLELVSLPKDLSVQDAVTLYMSNPNVLFAEPNYIRKPLAVPQDTMFGQQWALNNTGQFAGGLAGADIDATAAWDITSGSSSVIIAVLDTGVDYNHPDLVGNIWTGGESNCTDGIDNDGNGLVDDCRGWNFFDNNKTPMDDHGHGTHISGIIGAVGNNFMGMAGVMWHVNIMPLKFIGYHADPADCGGDTNFCGDVFDEIDAIYYAVSKGAKVINASFGDNVYSAAERTAIADADEAQVLFVAAAGNDGSNNDHSPIYPASYDLLNIISVAASDQNDQRASFSNYGPASVDVAAPGVYILSTIPTFIMPNGYDFFDGTSMAAPHVSGLAGLLWSYYTHFNHYQVLWTILRYSDPTHMTGWTLTGGRINAYRALSSLLTPANFTATPVSTSTIDLMWTDAATGEDGYIVERRTGGGAYTQIASLPAQSSALNDNGLADGTLYFYRVKAFNTLPADSFYAETSAATFLSPPTNLSATAPSNTNVLLTWTDNSATESGYRIERTSKYTEYAEIATVGANVTSYNDPTVVGTTRYYYRVRAFNANGTSDYSNEVSIRPRRSSGGGGCSIGGVHNTPSALGNLAVMLLPLAVIALLRRRV
jgi:subtilisin family serine protease